MLISEIMWKLFCRYCNASPNETCRTKSGKPCVMHSARWYDAKPFWEAQSTRVPGGRPDWVQSVAEKASRT